MEENGNIIIYQTEDGLTKLDVQLHDETVWLSQQQMAELFHSSRTNIVEHIKHIYQEGELLEISTCRKFRQVQQEGNRMVNREIPFYNLHNQSNSSRHEDKTLILPFDTFFYAIMQHILRSTCCADVTQRYLYPTASGDKEVEERPFLSQQ